MANTKKLFTALTMRGPHRVLCGELSVAGVPGMVFTPEEGTGLPAVAFAHGWLIDPDRYAGTLRHLASWGIVAAAPRTQRGPVPSHLDMAADLGTALEVCSTVRLGPGEISVHPDRLGVAGHGMGGSAAVLAAAGRPDLRAVAALFPQPSAPPAVSVAADISAPLLATVTPGDAVNTTSIGRLLAAGWGGKSVVRSVDKASNEGLAEGRNLLSLLGYSGPQHGTQRVVRALLTGFLLHHLGDNSTYSAFAALGDPAAQEVLPDTVAVDPNGTPEPPKSLMQQLIRR
ncbi:dienelactone hydrolase family protein [Millisia brevis]|uniref:dienelactone hydrolase family protein n=1 Tax=Millisia brevis TaxID=264148 RepID=UPI00082AB95F|nr:dienelactone hydrolase family protein [Millisia brevis]